MCTLSFIPDESGYLVAMNRDEQFSRPRALPPRVFGKAIYPHEPSGGTWIAVNSRGLTLALLNKNEDGPLPAEKHSRGELIPAMIACDSLAEIHRRVVAFDLRSTYPFRLIAISPSERELCEWRWGSKLEQVHHDWEARHWFSSGVSDIEAEARRSVVVKRAWNIDGAGTRDWIRNLHKSHEPAPGAYSICVHRPDAASVSYSEIRVSANQITFRYAAGHPCEFHSFDAEITVTNEASLKFVVGL
ncbi:MAG TPA: NRDE family protein [Terriglobales bacterium]|nr:NRDE family protein [Terriglobales bacterium]